MSLKKAIEHGKEHRKPYHGSKDFDHTCRNHGGCSWCEENRKYKNLKREQKAMAQLEELMKENVDVLKRLKGEEECWDEWEAWKEYIEKRGE